MAYKVLATTFRDGKKETSRNVRALPPGGPHLRHVPGPDGTLPRPRRIEPTLRADHLQPVHPRAALLLGRRSDEPRRLRGQAVGPLRLPGLPRRDRRLADGRL